MSNQNQFLEIENIGTLLCKLCGPIILGVIFHGLYNIVDTFFVVISAYGIVWRINIFLLPALMVIPLTWGIRFIWHAVPFADGASTFLITVFLMRELGQLKTGTDPEIETIRVKEGV